MRSSFKDVLETVSAVPASATLPDDVERQHTVLVRGDDEYRDVTQLEGVEYDETSGMYIIQRELPANAVAQEATVGPLDQIASIQKSESGAYIEETVADKEMAFVVSNLISKLLNN